MLCYVYCVIRRHLHTTYKLKSWNSFWLKFCVHEQNTRKRAGEGKVSTFEVSVQVKCLRCLWFFFLTWNIIHLCLLCHVQLTIIPSHEVKKNYIFLITRDQDSSNSEELVSSHFTKDINFYHKNVRIERKSNYKNVCRWEGKRKFIESIENEREAKMVTFNETISWSFVSFLAFSVVRETFDNISALQKNLSLFLPFLR